MIESTFCHLPNISIAEEKRLWRKGLRNWDDLLCWAAVYADDASYRTLEDAIARSRLALASKEAEFFLHALPESEQFRIFTDFGNQLFYLDIETDGLDQNANINCLSILNQDEMRSYLYTENFEHADRQLAAIQIAVTFNGNRFDIPRIIRRFPDFRISFHIDLAVILPYHGLIGRLKEVAQRLGWKSCRSSPSITTGKEAAQAWHTYLQSGDATILHELIGYNQEDVRILQFLMQALSTRHGRSIFL